MNDIIEQWKREIEEDLRQIRLNFNRPPVKPMVYGDGSGFLGVIPDASVPENEMYVLHYANESTPEEFVVTIRVPTLGGFGVIKLDKRGCAKITGIGLPKENQDGNS